MKPFPQELNPLFSSFVTVYTLILLYLPSFFLNLLFSPVLFSAAILLLCILRFGADAHKGDPVPISLQYETESPTDAPHLHDPDPDSSPRGSFMEWDVGAPLEVIQEACCEGEDAPDDAVSAKTTSIPAGNYEDRRFGNLLERYPSLSRYYPETDSDSDSESNSDPDSFSSVEGDLHVIGRSDCSPCNFRCVGEEIDEEKYGLIEIQLDGDCGKSKVLEEFEFHTEEENFIEIDISPVTSGDRLSTN